MALARSMLISDFSETSNVKPSYRVIIDHINNNPRGKDIPDKLNEEFVVLENEGTEKVSLAGWSLTDETITGKRPHVYKFPQNSHPFTSRESLRSHGTGRRFVRKRQPPKVEPALGTAQFRLEQ